MAYITKIFGPPGTGKTTRVLEIIETEMAAGVPPERIAFATFTVEARVQGIERARAKFGYTRDRLPYFRTIHSTAFRELAMNRHNLIASTDDLIPFGDTVNLQFSPQEMTEERALGESSPGTLNGDRWLHFEHFRRHALLTVDEAVSRWPHLIESNPEGTRYLLRHLTTEYERWKSEQGLRDFTDLLEHAGTPLPVDVVIVDEAQDLSKLQWRVLDKFAGNAKRIYYAGDDDQAIFTWAGANAQIFLDRPADQIEVLHQSHRLPKTVHQVATRLTDYIKVRQAKEFSPRKSEGEVRRMGPISAVNPIYLRSLFEREGTWLILVRAHYQARVVEKRLRQFGLPYLRQGRNPAPGTRWKRAILAWLQLQEGKPITKREAREVLRALRRDVAPVDGLPNEVTAKDLGVDTSRSWSASFDALTPDVRAYLLFLTDRYGIDALTQAPRIRISSIHAAKGDEADHVLLITDLPPKAADELRKDPDAEIRVWYVGVTRARESLWLAWFSNPLFR